MLILTLFSFQLWMYVSASRSPVFRCGFNTGDPPCFFEESPGNFTITTDRSPFPDIGPLGAKEGDGYGYWAINTTENNDFSSYAIKTTLNLTVGVTHCLVFDYHVDNVDGVSIKADIINSGDSNVLPNLEEGLYGNVWEWAKNEFNTTSGSEIEIKFSVLAARAVTTGLTDTYGVVAIDNVELYEGICGCIHDPCLNGGICYEDLVEEVSNCTCVDGFIGSQCVVGFDDGELQCDFSDYADACFGQIFYSGITSWGYGKGPRAKGLTVPALESEGYLYNTYINSDVVAPLITFVNLIEKCDAYIIKYDYFMSGDVGTLALANEASRFFTNITGDQGSNWQSEVYYLDYRAMPFNVLFLAYIQPVPTTQSRIAIDNVNITCVNIPSTTSAPSMITFNAPSTTTINAQSTTDTSAPSITINAPSTMSNRETSMTTTDDSLRKCDLQYLLRRERQYRNF